MRRLRAAGVIQRTVAILDPKSLGYPLLTVARVKLDRPREKAMREFERRMRQLPRVVHCLTVAGDIDYVVLVRSRDVADYHDFARHVLAMAFFIRSYTSEIVLDVPKWTTEVPVEDGCSRLGWRRANLPSSRPETRLPQSPPHPEMRVIGPAPPSPPPSHRRRRRW